MRALLALAALAPALALAQADGRRALLEALEAIVAKEPAHVGAMYTAA
jgi:hypothetical protein